MRKCPDMARHLQQRLEPLCYSRLYQCTVVRNFRTLKAASSGSQAKRHT